MSKKTRILVIAMSLSAVLALSIGGVAMAAGPEDAPGTTNVVCDGTGQGYGIGLGGAAICTDNVSALLGLTSDEIRDMRRDGKSLVQIAVTQNVTEEQLMNTIIAARQAWVEARVADGTLTQERATLMLQNMEKNIVKAINHTTGKPEWAGQKGGNGNGQLKQQARGNSAHSYGEPGDGTGPGNMNKWGRGNGR